MQTTIREGTAQEQIDAANHNLDRLGGDLRSDDTKDRLRFYFQARIEMANAMNLQRIADSLEKLASPKTVSGEPDTCNCGAGQAGPPNHLKDCPMWAPF